MNHLPLKTSQRAKLKPVMFWLHGGAFEIGTGADPIADGGNLGSRGDVVVVVGQVCNGVVDFAAVQVDVQGVGVVCRVDDRDGHGAVGVLPSSDIDLLDVGGAVDARSAEASEAEVA